MATNVSLVHFTTLTGGSSGALDAVPLNAPAKPEILAGAVAIGFDSNGSFLSYQLQNSAGAVESVPGVILPDTPHENKWWKLMPPWPPPAGHVIRPVFSQSSATGITMTPGGKGAGYHLDGVGWVYFESAITYTFTSLSSYAFSYLYIDASTITAPGVIAAANLIDSATAPGADGYNGSDRCIFAVFGLGPTQMWEFYHDGGDFVSFPNDITINPSAVTTSFAAVTLVAPAFCKKMEVLTNVNASNNYVYYRVTGSTDSIGLQLAASTTVVARPIVTVLMNSSQQIDLKASTAIGINILWARGWYLPAGM